MHDDTIETGAAPSEEHASTRKTRAITAVVIALAIGSVAFVVQPGSTRSERIDYAAAGVANLASSVAADVPATDVGSVAGSSTAPRFQRTDEPAYTDSMNPHGG